jgi:hypothetical protein
MTERALTPLAARRQALIAECGLQRIEAGREIMALFEPAHQPGGWRQYLGRDLKIPLTIAGVVLGMAVAKPARAIPMITAGFSLWKFARPLLAQLRSGTKAEA